MRFLALIVLLTSSLAFAADPATQPTTRPAIPAGAIEWHGHHYLLADHKAKQADALREAAAMGGHLIIFETVEERDWANKTWNYRILYPATSNLKSGKPSILNMYTGVEEGMIFSRKQFGGKGDVAVAHDKMIGFRKDEGFNFVVEWDY